MFVCKNCGNEFGKWAGQCAACGEWNSLKEVSARMAPKKQSSGLVRGDGEARNLNKILNSGNNTNRILTKIGEFDRVLGNGIVRGGVILFAGEPGIGKSTLLTQIAGKIGALYVAGEESQEQIGARVERLGLPKDKIWVLETGMVADLARAWERLEVKPELIIVDSIQTMTPMGEATGGGVGSVSGIRVATMELAQLAKTWKTAMVLVGHVTKEGEIAGPKLLEHMVDVVIYLEGERSSDLRILRGVKNRFGPTDEVGVFRMGGKGFEEVRGEELSFLETKEVSPGLAVGVVSEGGRLVMVEVQALVVESFAPQPRRVFAGLDYNRAQLMLAVVQKYLNVPLYKYDVFLGVAGGMKVSEPALDLAIVASIYSSFKNKALPKNSAYVGEVSLLGRVKKPKMWEKRVKEAKALGKSVLEIEAVRELLK